MDASETGLCISPIKSENSKSIFKCPVCPKCFIFENTLQLHISSHQGDESRKEIESSTLTKNTNMMVMKPSVHRSLVKRKKRKRMRKDDDLIRRPPDVNEDDEASLEMDILFGTIGRVAGASTPAVEHKLQHADPGFTLGDPGVVASRNKIQRAAPNVSDNLKNENDKENNKPYVEVVKNTGDSTLVMDGNKSDKADVTAEENDIIMCSENTKKKYKKAAHKKIPRKSDRKFVCQECHGEFKRRIDMKRHVEQVHAKHPNKWKRLQCRQCSFFTHNNDLYWSHILVEHNIFNRHRFFCGYPSCWFPFQTFAEKQIHERKEHGGIAKTYLCDLCPRSFENGKLLMYHRKKCTKRPIYRCPFCLLQMKKFQSLAKHSKSRHQQDILLLEKRQYIIYPPGDTKLECIDISEYGGVDSSDDLDTASKNTCPICDSIKGTFILCSKCGSGFHQVCLGPRENEDPRNTNSDWKCPMCSNFFPDGSNSGITQVQAPIDRVVADIVVTDNVDEDLVHTKDIIDCATGAKKKKGLSKKVDVIKNYKFFESESNTDNINYKLSLEEETEAVNEEESIDDHDDHAGCFPNSSTIVTERNGKRVYICPLDDKVFVNRTIFHRHCHIVHLDYGTDIGVCPIGVDEFSCICGKVTNCRHSFVVHANRCYVNLGIKSHSSRKVGESTSVPYSLSSLTQQRRLKRKLKQLGGGKKNKKSTNEEEVKVKKMCDALVRARAIDMTRSCSGESTTSRQGVSNRHYDQESTGLRESLAMEQVPQCGKTPTNAQIEHEDSLDQGDIGKHRVIPGVTRKSFKNNTLLKAKSKKNELKMLKDRSNTTCKKTDQFNNRKRSKLKRRGIVVSEDENLDLAHSTKSVTEKIKCTICQKFYNSREILDHFCGVDYDGGMPRVDLDLGDGECGFSHKEDTIDISSSDEVVTLDDDDDDDEMIPSIRSNIDRLNYLENVALSIKNDGNVTNYCSMRQGFLPITISAPDLKFHMILEPSANPGASPASWEKPKLGSSKTRGKLKNKRRKGYTPTKKKYGLK